MRVAHGVSRREIGGVMSGWNPDRFAHLVLDAHGQTALDRALEPFGQTVEGLLFLDSLTRSRSDIPDPAAVVVYPKDYLLSGHMLQLRGERTDVKFTYCSYKPTDPPLAYPPVSLVYVPDREILSILALKSPMLAQAWTLVCDTDPTARWLCIVDPLAADWVSDAERMDRALFDGLRVTTQ